MLGQGEVGRPIVPLSLDADVLCNVTEQTARVNITADARAMANGRTAGLWVNRGTRSHYRIQAKISIFVQGMPQRHGRRCTLAKSGIIKVSSG